MQVERKIKRKIQFEAILLIYYNEYVITLIFFYFITINVCIFLHNVIQSSLVFKNVNVVLESFHLPTFTYLKNWNMYIVEEYRKCNFNKIFFL